MSLRIKLTLFTVGFVLLASLAVLGVSVFQILQKQQRDIRILRTNELKRAQGNLQNSVNLICSALEDRSGTLEISSNLEGIIKKLRKSTTTGNAGWIWVFDTGAVDQPILLSGTRELHVSVRTSISKLLQSARGSGSATFESSTPPESDTDSISVDQSHVYWYARSITPGGPVLAVGAPLGSLDAAINVRTAAVQEEITRMVKDRMLFSLFLILACAVAIFLFSKIITGPVNKLVDLTESIAAGRTGFADRITIKSHDEIGRLAGSFNAMLLHVQNSLNMLEATAAKYRELVENANSAIIHLDEKGTVLFINEYAQQLFGFAPQAVVGRNITETIGRAPDNQADGDDMFLNPEKHPYLEREHQTQNDTRIWIGWTNRPLIDNDQKRAGTLCVGSDITKSKEAEEFAALQQRKLIQADKMATLGVLVSGVAHEVNNPNNYIILNAQSLHSMWPDLAPVLDAFATENPDYAVAGLAYRELRTEIPGMLKGIADGALRIKSIVQNLKDFSRTEPDDMSQKVDIARVLDAAQIIVGNMIRKSTNHFSVAVSPDLPPVRGNFQRIEQVVINLLTNACQATDDTSKPVKMTAEYRRRTNEIIITVSDRGKGIRMIDMKHIFDPFFTTKRDEGGTGLGLAVSYSIVKDHGGDLRINSEEEVGTTATLILPVL